MKLELSMKDRARVRERAVEVLGTVAIKRFLVELVSVRVNEGLTSLLMDGKENLRTTIPGISLLQVELVQEFMTENVIDSLLIALGDVADEEEAKEKEAKEKPDEPVVDAPEPASQEEPRSEPSA